jgi:putative ABC transport system permease protein
MDERLGPTQVTSLIWLSFGAVALALTTVGLYGILAGNVARRTREIGIRAALGADRVQIVRLVIGDTAVLVVLGLALGAAGAVKVNEVIRAFLFGARPDDLATVVGVVSLILVVAAIAAFVPARRAVSVDPTVALRPE